ncbi:MAG: cytochrome c oxidase subunit II [Candidatus Flexifilum sp.]
MSLTRQQPGTQAGVNATTLIWLIAAALAIIFGGILIGTFAPVVLPPQASAESRQVDALFQFMLAIGGMIFLLVQGALVYSIIRFRARPGDRADGPPIRGNATLELVWTIIPGIIVLVLTGLAYVVYADTRIVTGGEQQIGVHGARYAWTFNYTFTANDLPADLDISTLPVDIQTALADPEHVFTFSHQQMHTWVNQRVDAVITAADVNHAFWVPAMRVKQDALVGRTTYVRFTPIEAGVYRIVCAELCGSGHGVMAGEVAPDGSLVGSWLIVHPDEESYRQEFLIPQMMKILFPPEDPVERGRQLLASGQYPCASCHTLTDLGWVGNVGPSLNGIGARTQRVAASGARDMADYIHTSIRMPGAYLVPGYGNLMTQFNPNPDQPNYMPEADLEAIVAYLLSQQ